MIYYDWMAEGWVSDDENEKFFVGMTPEGEGSGEFEDLGSTFATEKAFWEWYNN
jgi:hypothetical protein